jgi:ribosomal protein S27AE
MGKNSSLIGIILIVGGVLVFLGCSVISVVSAFGAEGNSIGGATLGVVLSLFLAIPLIGAGVFLLARDRSEAARQADAVRQRKILDMVKTRGQVNISDIVLELRSTTEQVRNDLYGLVGMGLLKGYVNWDKGLLYSAEAGQLKNNICPNCGGQLALAGKGVITCPYCGTDIFL